MKAFVDTYALLALVNVKDGNHMRVKDYLESFRGRLVTTEWVFVEVADALSAPQARGDCVSLLQRIASDDQFDVIGATSDFLGRGLRFYAARLDKAWSLTDCLSFVVMTERGIADALTADRHFAQAGFNPIFAQS